MAKEHPRFAGGVANLSRAIVLDFERSTVNYAVYTMPSSLLETREGAESHAIPVFYGGRGVIYLHMSRVEPRDSRWALVPIEEER